MNVALYRLTNCRMGSVEVMETFCYNLSKNTSLVELRLLLNIVWCNFIIGTFHYQFDKCWHQTGQPGCTIKRFTETGKYSSVEVTACGIHNSYHWTLFKRLQYNKIGEECCDALKTFVTKAHLMFLE